MPNKSTNSMLQTLQTEHDELLLEIADLKQFWSEVNELGQGPKYEEMGTRVEHFRERFRQHIAEEERDGYLAPALAVAPRFASKADELKQQHQRLLDALDRFSQQLQNREAAYHNWEEVHAEFEEFLTQLREHESAEMAILRGASA